MGIRKLEVCWKRYILMQQRRAGGSLTTRIKITGKGMSWESGQDMVYPNECWTAYSVISLDTWRGQCRRLGRTVAWCVVSVPWPLSLCQSRWADTRRHFGERERKICIAISEKSNCPSRSCQIKAFLCFTDVICFGWIACSFSPFSSLYLFPSFHWSFSSGKE